MKRGLLLALILILAASVLWAEEVVYPILTPKNAKAMALGGSFSSIPGGEFSFYGNPAGFASRTNSLTLASAEAWAYVKPTTENINSFMEGITAADESRKITAVLGLMPANGGIGAGASSSVFAYAGKGLGLGGFVTTDQYIDGNDLMSANIISDTQVNAVIGLGVPLQLGGLRLMVGGDIRPFYRIRSEISLANTIAGLDLSNFDTDTALDRLMISAGYGLAMDLGASVQLGGLTLGLSMRDIAPPFPVWYGSVSEFVTAMDTGGLPTQGGADGTAAENLATFLPNISAGLAWKVRFLPGLIDPTLYFELQDPVSVIREEASALNLLHAGAELRLLSLVTLRGGINRGWLSAGAGVKLLFLEANAAVFTEELGALPGDNPRSGISLEAAIRF